MKRKKLIIPIMMIFMIALLTIPAFASCDVCIDNEQILYDANPNHCTALCVGDHYETCCACADQYIVDLCESEHSYTYMQDSGTHTGVCACGATVSGTCEFVFVSATSSTCSQEGYEIWRCKDCGVSRTIILPIGDHTYSDEPTSVHLPTCRTVGYNEWLCETCDDFKTDGHVPPLGHDWDESEIAPTCEAKGYNYMVCKRCMLDESKEIPELGHKWSDNWTSNSSTCFYKGKAIYLCTVCGEEESRDAGYRPHEYVNGKCTMCLKLEEADEPDLPQGTITPGTNSGDRNSLFESLGNIEKVDPKRLLSLLSVVALFTGFVWFVRKRRS